MQNKCAFSVRSTVSTNGKINQTNPKANRVILKSNQAKAQSRHSGILFAPANGKLYFECLKIFSVPENHLPLQGVKTPPKLAFLLEIRSCVCSRYELQFVFNNV